MSDERRKEEERRRLVFYRSRLWADLHAFRKAPMLGCKCQLEWNCERERSPRSSIGISCASSALVFACVALCVHSEASCSISLEPTTSGTHGRRLRMW